MWIWGEKNCVGFGKAWVEVENIENFGKSVRLTGKFLENSTFVTWWQYFRPLAISYRWGSCSIVYGRQNNPMAKICHFSKFFYSLKKPMLPLYHSTGNRMTNLMMYRTWPFMAKITTLRSKIGQKWQKWLFQVNYNHVIYHSTGNRPKNSKMILKIFYHKQNNPLIFENWPKMAKMVNLSHIYACYSSFCWKSSQEFKNDD